MSEASPYFSLAQDQFIRSPTPNPAGRTRKRNVKSIIEVFGEFAKMDDEKQANFLLQLLSYSSFQPDFAQMADKLEIQHTMAMFVLLLSHLRFTEWWSRQRRFEAIARKNGYALEEGKVVPKETGGNLEIPAQQIVQRQIKNYNAAASKVSNNGKYQSKSGSKKQPCKRQQFEITKNYPD